MADIRADTSTYPKANPNWNPLEYAQRGLALQQQQQELAMRQLELQRQRFNSIGNLITPLMAKKDGISMDDIRERVVAAVEMKLVDPQTAASVMSQAAQRQASGRGLFEFVQQMSQATVGAEKAMEQQMGQLVGVDTGPGITYQRAPGMLAGPGQPEQMRPASPLMRKDLTPGEAAQRQTIYDENGKPRSVATAEVTPTLPQYRRYGEPALPPMAEDKDTSWADKPAAAPGTNPLQGKPMGPQVKSETSPLQGVPRGENPLGRQRASGWPEIRSGLSPQENVEQTQQGEMAAQMNAGADAAVRQNVSLGKLEDAVSRIKTGGGAELRSTAAQVLQAMGLPKDLVDKVGNQDLAAGQVAQKQMLDAVTQTMNARFNGKMPSNFEFSSFMDRFPSINTDPGAVREMIKYFKAMNQMAIDKNKAYQQVKSKMDATKFESEVWIPYVTNPKSPYLRMMGK